MDFVRSLKSKIAASTHHDLREKERKEDYFSFAKTVQHGFPAHSSCLAYDMHLDIFAIGTKNGYIKVYGAPGVEFAGQHTNSSALIRLMFLPNQGRLISLCEDQTFYLWEIVNASADNNFSASLNVVKEYSASGKLKKISCWCYCPASIDASNPRSSMILLGTESGNIYSLDCSTFDLIDYLIYQDVVIQNIPDDYKLNPGAVEALALHPTDPSKVLIGYNRGLIILWDTRTYSARQSFVENFRIESLCWCRRLSLDEQEEGRDMQMNGSQDESLMEEEFEYRFLSAHNDGSYVCRSFSDDDDNRHTDNTRTEFKPFGPFPLKPIEKILQAKLKNGDEVVVFSGGMPRSSFADKFVVTVERCPADSSRTKRVCFDFTSKVVDFLLIDEINENCLYASALLILCEEELVGIDLLDSDWPQFRLPYCRSLHCSPITASIYASALAEDAYEKITSASRDWNQRRGLIDRRQMAPTAVNGEDSDQTPHHYYSEREWPVRGGHVIESGKLLERDFLITGHEDGTVKFWSGRLSNMDLICTLNTSRLFEEYIEPNNELNDEENWPPFRRVGLYDPYTDDPRFAVQRLAFDSLTGILTVGGSAGQVMVFELAETEGICKLEPVSVDLTVRTGNTFAWKGREKLIYTEKYTAEPPSSDAYVKFGPCPFAPKCVLQLNPPAAITALTTRPDWRLVGIGSAQGFALIDYQLRHVIVAECLLTSSEIDSGIASTEGTVSRLKSFKKSLRESFRRKRHRRSVRGGSVSPDSKSARSNETGAGKKDKRDGNSNFTATSATLPSTRDEGVPLMRAVERSIEARTDSNCLSSMVRCLHLRKAAFAHAISASPTFWIGTNGGEIYIYLLNLSTGGPPGGAGVAQSATTTTVVQSSGAESQPADRSSSPGCLTSTTSGSFTCQLAKHIRLKHAAPVLSIFLVDSRGFDIDNRPSGVSTGGSSPDHASRLIIVSEEQLKAFHWPKIIPSRIKNKITAIEGSRVRKVLLTNFKNKHDETRWEPFLIVMTNQGELEAFSSQNFRRCFKEQCVPSQMISSILSTVLTARGEGFFLLSSSEWQRFNVGAAGDRGIRPRCTLAPIPEAESPAVLANGEEHSPRQTNGQEHGQAASDQSNSSILTPEDLRNLSASLSNDTTLDSIRDYTTTTINPNSIVSS